MALHHRKFLLEDQTDKKYPSPSCYICYICPKDCYLSPPPQPLESKSHRFSVILIIMLCLLGAVFLFLSYLTIVKHRSRRRNPEPVEHGDFVGQNQWPVLDHPVWYIRTVGLPQSTIDSISKFEYKKNEGLIEGSDCAVCLNEFRENESLRLLPKCSHAFHVPCIDTWLRSHKNCPICRVPVLIADANNNNNNNSVGLSLNEMSLINSVSTEENRVRDVSESRRDENNAQNHSADINSSKSGLNFDQSDKQIRVLSDLADHRSVKFDRKLEHPMRRSVSMDFSSASTICRVIKSSSIGRSLEKGPVSMKRSFSFSGKRSMRKSSRSMESISISIPEISTQNRNQ